MISSVNTQIQRAIIDAISSQILPQIQSVLSAGPGHSTQNRWNVPSEIPGATSEVLQNTSSRDNSRSKPNRDRPYDRPTDLYAYDNIPHPSDRLVFFRPHILKMGEENHDL